MGTEKGLIYMGDYLIGVWHAYEVTDLQLFALSLVSGAVAVRIIDALTPTVTRVIAWCAAIRAMRAELRERRIDAAWNRGRSGGGVL